MHKQKPPSGQDIAFFQHILFVLTVLINFWLRHLFFARHVYTARDGNHRSETQHCSMLGHPERSGLLIRQVFFSSKCSVMKR